MRAETWTPEGQAKRAKEIAEGYAATGNVAGLVRFIGGSAADFDERRDPFFGGSHPDERRH
jgi:hypothetical protein